VPGLTPLTSLPKSANLLGSAEAGRGNGTSSIAIEMTGRVGGSRSECYLCTFCLDVSLDSPSTAGCKKITIKQHSSSLSSGKRNFMIFGAWGMQAINVDGHNTCKK